MASFRIRTKNPHATDLGSQVGTETVFNGSEEQLKAMQEAYRGFGGSVDILGPSEQPYAGTPAPPPPMRPQVPPPGGGGAGGQLPALGGSLNIPAPEATGYAALKAPSALNPNLGQRNPPQASQALAALKRIF